MDELMRLQSELEALLKTGRPLRDPQVHEVNQQLERVLDQELARLYLPHPRVAGETVTSQDTRPEASGSVPPPEARAGRTRSKVTQLRCALCDHWFGNGGGCGGRGGCEDFRI